MSYTELDAWIDEKALGDWPFDRWDIGELRLREGHRYFDHPYGVARLGALHHRLLSSFGMPDEARLRACLTAATETVRCAIEESDSDAYSAWCYHEVWLPVLDDSLNGSAEPADMLVQSIDYVGVPDGFVEQEVCASMGLWLIGESTFLPRSQTDDHSDLLVQIGIATAEAEFYRGLLAGRKLETDKLTKRVRKASEARHAANRARLKQAEEWWKASALGHLSQAEAARQIAGQFHVVEDVAKRWVRQFQRKSEAAA